MMLLDISTNAIDKWLQVNTMAQALPNSGHNTTVPVQEDNQAKATQATN